MAAATGDGCVRGRPAAAGRRLCYTRRPGTVGGRPADGVGGGGRQRWRRRQQPFPRVSGGAVPAVGHLRRRLWLPRGASRVRRGTGGAARGGSEGGLRPCQRSPEGERSPRGRVPSLSFPSPAGRGQEASCRLPAALGVWRRAAWPGGSAWGPVPSPVPEGSRKGVEVRETLGRRRRRGWRG